ncbi:MAG: hypothetical protein QM479_13905 [Pseudomonadota bacterium]
MIKYTNKNKGFGLIELVMILGLMTAVGASIIKLLQEKSSLIDHQNQWLSIAEQKLISFAIREGRLPCPDHNGNALEDCSGADKGKLPYKSLGLTASQWGRGDSGMLYGVYRNTDLTTIADIELVAEDSQLNAIYAYDADLTSSLNRYQPRRADGKYSDFNNINALDLCIALENADTAAISTNYLYVQHNSAINNIAFALAYPGKIDADGINGVFDGLNGQSGPGFNLPNKSLDAAYDDNVRIKSFIDLKAVFKCDAVINSLNILAVAVQTQGSLIAVAENTKQGAETGLAMSAFTTAANVYAGVLAGFALASASTTLATASAALAASTAACAVVIGCIGIATYTPAVVAATTGVTLSGIAVAAVVASVTADGIATGLYADLNSKAGNAVNIDVADFTAIITELNNTLVDLRVTEAAAATAATNARAVATSVQETYISRRDSIFIYARANDNKGSDPPLITSINSAIDEFDLAISMNTSYQQAVSAKIKLEALCNPTVINGVVQGNPSDPSCATLPAVQINVNTLKNELDTQIQVASTASVTASSAADNYLYYEGSNVYKNCSTTSNCSLTSTQIAQALGDPSDNSQPVGSYQDYLDKNVLAEIKEKVALALTQSLTELESSLASLECLQSGKVYDVNTGICSTSTLTTGTVINYASGAENILEQADQQAITQ